MRICNFEGSRTIGKPVDWVDDLDGECLAIHVCDAIDTLTGLSVQYTVFKLSDVEIEALKSGGVVRLGIVGMKQHPVFTIGVLGPETTNNANLTPSGDMGDLIAP